MRQIDTRAALRQVDARIQAMEIEAHRQWTARLTQIHTDEAETYERLLATLAMPDGAEMRAQAQGYTDKLTDLWAMKQAHYAMLPTWTTQPGAEELINRRERLLCQ